MDGLKLLRILCYAAASVYFAVWLGTSARDVWLANTGGPGSLTEDLLHLAGRKVDRLTERALRLLRDDSRAQAIIGNLPDPGNCESYGSLEDPGDPDRLADVVTEANRLYYTAEYDRSLELALEAFARRCHIYGSSPDDGVLDAEERRIVELLALARRFDEAGMMIRTRSPGKGDAFLRQSEFKSILSSPYRYSNPSRDLRLLARGLRQSGEFPAALRAARRGLLAARESFGPYSLDAYLLRIEVARAQLSLGDLVEAERGITRVLNDIEPHPPDPTEKFSNHMRVRTLTVLAEVHLARRDGERLMETVELAESAFTSHTKSLREPFERLRVHAEAMLGRVERADAGVATVERARWRPYRIQAEDKMAEVELHLTRGDRETALARSEEAYALFVKDLTAGHRLSGRAMLKTASIQIELGHLGPAAESLKRAREALEAASGPDGPDAAELASTEGLLHWASGDAQAAVDLLGRAGRLLDERIEPWLALGDEQRKRSLMRSLALDQNRLLALHMSELESDPVASEAALGMLLSRRGRVLDVLTAEVRWLAAAGPSIAPLLQELKAATAAYAQVQLAEIGSGRASAESRSSLRDATKRRREAKKRLAAVVDLSGQGTASTQLDAVRAALPEAGILVEIAEWTPFFPVVGEEEDVRPRYAVYWMSKRGLGAFDLGLRAEIDSLVTSMRGEIQHLRDYRLVGREEGPARALGSRLIDPIVAGQGAEAQLLIVPEGSLHRVPFSALSLADSRAAIEHHRITLLSSGRDLLSLPASRRRASEGSLGSIIFADPDFDAAETFASNTTPASLQGSSSRYAVRSALGDMHFERLPGTRSEADALARILPRPHSYLGASATEAQIKALHRPWLLHLATHGYFLAGRRSGSAGTARGILIVPSVGPAAPAVDVPVGFKKKGSDGSPKKKTGAPPAQDTARPNFAGDRLELRFDSVDDTSMLRSGLVFAGANLDPRGEQHGDAEAKSGAGEDGILTALEAAGLDLHGTELVVLSACETGLGDVATGEGIFGLRRALTMAGARTQVMSLWPIADDSTRDLMVEFHRALRSGKGPGDALRQAQSSMRRRPGREHPYHWASFVVVGDWRAFPN